MSEVDLPAVARQAARAIVALIGPGQTVATPRKVLSGMTVVHIEFEPGGEDKAVEGLAKEVQARGIRRFMMRGTGSAVVTEDGVSVRASSYHDTSGRLYCRIDVMGLGGA